MNNDYTRACRAINSRLMAVLGIEHSDSGPGVSPDFVHQYEKFAHDKDDYLALIAKLKDQLAKVTISSPSKSLLRANVYAFMPRVRQFQTDGASVSFPINATTKKVQRIDHHQADFIQDLISAATIDGTLFQDTETSVLNLPTFFYQTGAVMTIEIDLCNLAKAVLVEYTFMMAAS